MPEDKTQTAWNLFTSYLEKNLSKPIYEALLNQSQPLTVDDGTLLISVQNVFSRDWLKEKCGTIIEDSINLLSSEGVSKIEFTVIPSNEPRPTAKFAPEYLSSSPKMNGAAAILNPRYTFSSFVVGHGNRFAHAASLAVAESPAKAYNPLFLYGGVGLGKTHLMQAIGLYVIQNSPGAKVIYVTSEQFTNELIAAIREDKTTEFRNRYRNIDILLIDDIQFIAGKERTQEEFFHTFNTLHESSKQIVVSSDRPPKEILTLEERLRSRFEWGLTADIQIPDYETRIAILQKKAQINELEVPNEVLDVIATRITSNIRQLEGALIRIVAQASVNGQDLTAETAEQCIKDFISPSKGKPISISLIKKATAEYYTVKIDDMSAKTRTREIATARQVAMYLARELTKASLPKIGEEFGGRDHSTVIHAHDKITEAIKSATEIEEAVKEITKNIKIAAS
jgi:chromosomal replication initiator protein